MNGLYEKRWGIMFRTGTILGGILCLAAGIFLGQEQDVWVKGIYICLECIGIG